MIQNIYPVTEKYTEDSSKLMMADKLFEVFGKEAININLDTFIRFAGLDLSLLDEAFTSLDKVYPKTFSEYLRTYLEARQPLCRSFAEGYSTAGLVNEKT